MSAHLRHTGWGVLISVTPIFPRRQSLSSLMKPHSSFPASIPRRVSASCTFQQVFAKRAGISRPDECSQYGSTASWNLRRATVKCAEFQLECGAGGGYTWKGAHLTASRNRGRA